jgi:hypothetical protein
MTEGHIFAAAAVRYGARPFSKAMEQVQIRPKSRQIYSFEVEQRRAIGSMWGGNESREM